MEACGEEVFDNRACGKVDPENRNEKLKSSALPKASAPPAALRNASMRTPGSRFSGFRAEGLDANSVSRFHNMGCIRSVSVLAQ